MSDTGNGGRSEAQSMKIEPRTGATRPRSDPCATGIAYSDHETKDTISCRDGRRKGMMIRLDAKRHKRNAVARIPRERSGLRPPIQPGGGLIIGRHRRYLTVTACLSRRLPPTPGHGTRMESFRHHGTDAGLAFTATPTSLSCLVRPGQLVDAQQLPCHQPGDPTEPRQL